jgi:hypothetical protein
MGKEGHRATHSGILGFVAAQDVTQNWLIFNNDDEHTNTSTTSMDSSPVILTGTCSLTATVPPAVSENSNLVVKIGYCCLSKPT